MINQSTVWLSLIIALPVIPCVSFAEGITGRSPNIIFILTDDQGYGDLSVHGNPVLRTTHLDRLHGESVRFTDFHVSPTCSPTRSALLTGRHEFKNGVTHTILERERLALDAVTLAEVLKDSGYTTAIFGKWHLGDEDEYQPGARGYDEVFIHGGGGIGQSYPGSCGDAPGNTYFDPTLLHNGKFEPQEGFCTDLFFDRAIQWIDGQRHDERPFFATIATNAPHAPYTARPEDAALYENLAPSEQVAHFFGMIHNIDENVGRLMDQLRRWGLEENTLLVFMSDNGTAAGRQVFNADMRGSKGTAWVGGTRAISFWRWPGTIQPGDCSALAAHIDFFPTLAEIAGAELSAQAVQQVEGRSLVPLLEQPASSWEDRRLFTHLGRWPKLADPDDFKYRMAAVRSPRWALISPDGASQPRWQLFDLTVDYGQKNDVIANYPEVAGELAQEFEQWWEECQSNLVNEKVIGPRLNSFASRYWQQFGGEPSLEDYSRMAPTQPWPPKPQPGPLGGMVNPMIGTGGIPVLCGNNFPGATVPFGMVRLSPDSVTPRGGKATNMSGYYHGDRHLLGFSHTRLVGTGAIDGGNFLVVPSIQPFQEQQFESDLRYEYSHETERAFPGYYSVWLPEPNVLAELTATQRVGVHRYTFPANFQPHLQIHATSVLGKGKVSEGQVRILPNRREVEGSARTFGSFSSRYGGSKWYFVARLSAPVTGHRLWRDGNLLQDSDQAAGDWTSGDQVGIDLQFEQSDLPRTIELKLGVSTVSLENARENLEAEAGSRDFDQVLDAASQTWEQHLAKVRIHGGTDDQRTIFYTALYRCMNMPTEFNDVNGQYLGFDQQVHQADGFRYYTDMSLWDTFRTTHPLYTLVLPSEQLDMVRSLVQMSRQGGHLPRWPSGSGYTNSMFGTPADLVIAETYLKGIKDFDVETAYKKMRQTALSPTPPGSKFSGRGGIEHYIRYQYCPYDLVKESVSRTLEYCSADFAIARLAQALGYQDDASMFDERAKYYRNLWNAETQYFQPRHSDGSFFADFRPLMLTYLDRGGRYTSAYVEGSALQWRWAVPHDPDGLIGLFKSRDYFVEQLEEFFAQSVPRVGWLPNAYYWQGNQPDLFAAYLFNSAGRPDLTQKWVRWILEHKYGPAENGLDGNDDGGTLSAWYVFSSLGLYPVAGTDRYELGSPIWDRAEVDLGSRTLVITADRTDPAAVAVSRVLLDNQELADTRIGHAQLTGAAELRFEMAAGDSSQKE
jgi:predicted alpha-1,2-mannosidase